MKVAVYVVNEVTDEERVAIAAMLDGGTAKKRKASAAEMKEWLWQQGAHWRVALGSGDVTDAGDDLIGDDAEQVVGYPGQHLDNPDDVLEDLL